MYGGEYKTNQGQHNQYNIKQTKYGLAAVFFHLEHAERNDEQEYCTTSLVTTTDFGAGNPSRRWRISALSCE